MEQEVNLIRNILPKISWLVILAVLLAAALPGSGLASGQLLANRADQAAWQFDSNNPTATTVSVTPTTPSVSGCNIVDVYIDVNSVTNLYALDVRLTFNPAVIEVVDYDPGTSVVEVEPIIDPALNFKAGFTVRNEVNNFTGTIWYAATQTAPTPAAAGSGHVARLRLRAKSSASSPFNFTYIKLSDPNGIQINATGTNGTVSASTTVVPALSISRLNASQVQLSWPTATGVSKYHLYRSSLPYFTATDPAYQQLTPLTPPATQTFTDSVLGNPAINYFYTIRAECSGSGGAKSGVSNQVGKFEYTLFETADTDYTWIALPLTSAGIANASNLATNIQNNSNGAVNVLSVSKWNPVSQSIEAYDAVYGFGDFAVSVKFPYRVEIEIPSVSTGTVIWAQVGGLPSITQDIYRLYETADTDFSWIMQPLDLTSLATAYDLSVNIQNTTSAPSAVLSIGKWNGTGQSIEAYDHQYGFGDFATRFGYPYRVEININSGLYVTWP